MFLNCFLFCLNNICNTKGTSSLRMLLSLFIANIYSNIMSFLSGILLSDILLKPSLLFYVSNKKVLSQTNLTVLLEFITLPLHSL